MWIKKNMENCQILATDQHEYYYVYMIVESLTCSQDFEAMYREWVFI